MLRRRRSARAARARAADAARGTTGRSSRATSSRLSVGRRVAPASRVTASSSSLARRPPSAGLRGVALIVTTTSGPVDLLERDADVAAHRHRQALLDRLLQLDRRAAVAQARAQADRLGLAQRADRDREHRAVGHEHRVAAGVEGRVHQPERGHDALDLAAEHAALQAHRVADAERARAQQHDAGDQVAERLLRGEAEDDRRGRGADRDRARRRRRRCAARRPARRAARAAGSRSRRCPRSPASIRGAASGARPRPKSRASAQPRITSASTTKICSAVVPCIVRARVGTASCVHRPNSVAAVLPEQDHAREERREHRELQPRAPHGPRREPERQRQLTPALGRLAVVRSARRWTVTKP